jgi:beta-glucosidase
MDFTKKAREIVDKMTLEEKASQLKYDSPPIERLGIPRYQWWNEALHGVARAGTATMFPQAIGLAAMFDPKEMENIGDIISTEARAKYNENVRENDRDIYKGLTLWAPNVNIFRDPRWGRGQETYGEDPYLTSVLGVSFIRGLQGEGRYLKSAACAKHFAVHSGPEELRHEFNAEVTEKDLWETYLPAFEACVKEAKVESVMGAYNRTNGEPCCASKLLMKDILKEKWGFDGYYVSDCFALADLHEHHKVTSTAAESAALALKMGCDINCGNTYLHILQAYEQGLVTEDDITEAAVHAMRTRLRLGLFDEACEYNKIPYSVVACREHREEAMKAAANSIVLLKNENILPLSKNIKRLAVIGPNADNRTALIGNYCGTPPRYVTILEGIEEALEASSRLYYSEGCHIMKDRMEPRALPGDRISEAVSITKQAGLAVVCVGLDGRFEGEQVDNGNPNKENKLMKADKSMELPDSQKELLKAVITTGADIIVINLTGSAMNLKWLQDTPNVKGILQAWYPGAEGGRAVAKVLFGDVNPSGKLPVTFYESEEDLPDFMDYSMEGRTYRYFDGRTLYPFGYGLSYTSYTYSDLRTEYRSDTKQLKVEVTVQNTGAFFGEEIVQIYCKDLESVHAVRNYQLCAFKRISLQTGEKKKVSFTLGEKAFEVVDRDGNRRIDSNRFRIYAGGSQPDNKSIKLLGRKPLETELKLGV